MVQSREHPFFIIDAGGARVWEAVTAADVRDARGLVDKARLELLDVDGVPTSDEKKAKLRNYQAAKRRLELLADDFARSCAR